MATSHRTRHADMRHTCTSQCALMATCALMDTHTYVTFSVVCVYILCKCVYVVYMFTLSTWVNVPWWRRQYNWSHHIHICINYQHNWSQLFIELITSHWYIYIHYQYDWSHWYIYIRYQHNWSHWYIYIHYQYNWSHWYIYLNYHQKRRHVTHMYITYTQRIHTYTSMHLDGDVIHVYNTCYTCMHNKSTHSCDIHVHHIHTRTCDIQAWNASTYVSYRCDIQVHHKSYIAHTDVKHKVSIDVKCKYIHILQMSHTSTSHIHTDKWYMQITYPRRHVTCVCVTCAGHFS